MRFEKVVWAGVVITTLFLFAVVLLNIRDIGHFFSYTCSRNYVLSSSNAAEYEAIARAHIYPRHKENEIRSRTVFTDSGVSVANTHRLVRVEVVSENISRQGGSTRITRFVSASFDVLVDSCGHARVQR